MKATNTEMFKGVSLTIGSGRARGGGGGEERVLESSQERLLDRLNESIREWFRDSRTDLLMATRLVDFNTWPREKEAAACVFRIRSSSANRRVRSIQTSRPVGVNL